MNSTFDKLDYAGGKGGVSNIRSIEYGCTLRLFPYKVEASVCDGRTWMIILSVTRWDISM